MYIFLVLLSCFRCFGPSLVVLFQSISCFNRSTHADGISLQRCGTFLAPAMVRNSWCAASNSEFNTFVTGGGGKNSGCN